MAKKKKRKSSKRDPETTERNKRIAIAAAVVIGGASVFVGTALGVSELDERAANGMVSSDTPEISILFPMNEKGESWMPIAERERINELTHAAARGTRALSGVALEEVGRTILSTGWSEGAPDVRWDAEGRVTARVNWRRPAAVVRVGTQEILIDPRAHRLPLQYPIGESNQFYFLNASAGAPDLGELWIGDDLNDGMALQRLLSEHGLLAQVEGIDLGAGADNGTLVIVTNRDARIIWGGGPGHVLPGEQPTSVKINRLKALHQRTGRIDANVGLLDIRGPDITRMRRE